MFFRIPAARIRFLVSVFALLGLVLSPAPAQQRNFEQDRRIEAAQEELRSLMSKRRYEEVLQRADALLALDPTNPSAVVWKEEAQRRLAAPPTPERSTFTESGLPRLGEGVTATPTPRAAPSYTPEPLAPREAKSAGAGVSPLILIGAGVLVLLILVIVIFVILRARASRAEVRQALEEAVRERTGHGEASADVHDAVTQHSAIGGKSSAVPTPVADDDSVVQYGSVGQSDPETLSDRDTIPQQAEEVAQQPTARLEPPPTQKPEVETQQEEDDLPMSLETPAIPPEPPSSSGGGNEDTIALDFGGPSSAPSSEEQGSAGGTEDLTFGGLMFASEDETKKPSEQSQAQDGMSFNSLMFDNEQETRKPPESPEDDPNAMSFNSLMFEGADETRMPGSEAPAETGSAPAESDDPNAMSFNSLMFEGDETVAPGAEGDPAAETINLGETLPLPEIAGDSLPEDDPEATRALPPLNPPEGADQANTIKIQHDKVDKD